MIPGYASLPDVDDRHRRVLVQRRRVALAIVVTVLAVIVSLASGSRESTEPQDAAAGSATATLGVVGTGDETAVSAPADPAFLPGAKDVDAPEIITVNVPAPRAGTVLTGQASFIRWPQTLGLAPCATPHALIGARITVTNLNNARSVVCDNVSIESLSGGNTIIIHSDVFLEIADLVDAPIPVEIEF